MRRWGLTTGWSGPPTVSWCPRPSGFRFGSPGCEVSREGFEATPPATIDQGTFRPSVVSRSSDARGSLIVCVPVGVSYWENLIVANDWQ